MEEIKSEIIDKICKKQNFDELLLNIIQSNKENNINKLLNDIRDNKALTNQLKLKLYEDIFEYVTNINEYIKKNLKQIFSFAAKETIIQINNELKGENNKMLKEIKILIADDNIHICKFIKNYLEKYEDIEILGIANNDEDEIKMIEELKPEIVITDLMRNHKYTGLDIIKKYFNNNSKVEFLVISADYKDDVIKDGLEVAGYIKKPFDNYEIIYNELKRIKNIINEKQYKAWDIKYHNLEIIDINKHLTSADKKILDKLGIKIKNKKYTEYEYECLRMDFLVYYDDPEDDLSEEELQYQKSLDGTGVTREEYNTVLKKLETINETI